MNCWLNWRDIIDVLVEAWNSIGLQLEDLFSYVDDVLSPIAISCPSNTLSVTENGSSLKLTMLLLTLSSGVQMSHDKGQPIVEQSSL